MSTASEKISYAMIAEDDDEDFEIFSTAIGEISITIILSRAENGEILLQKLKGNDILPDILFMDILMPCKDGYKCLKEIRADKKFDELPIVMFSSVDDARTIEYCFREGSNFFIIKPNSIEDLKGMLERIFTIDWKNLYYPPLSQYILNSQ